MHEAWSHDDTLATSTSVLVFFDPDLWIFRLFHARWADNNCWRLLLPPCPRLRLRWRWRLSFLDILRKRKRRLWPWTALRGYRRSRLRLRLKLGLSSTKFVHHNIVPRLYLRVIITKCPRCLEEPSAKTSTKILLLLRTGITIVSLLRGSTTSFFATTPFSVRTP